MPVAVFLQEKVLVSVFIYFNLLMLPGTFPWTDKFPGARRGRDRVAGCLQPGASASFGSFRVCCVFRFKKRPFFLFKLFFDMLFGTFYQADGFPDKVWKEMVLIIHASTHPTPSAGLLRVCCHAVSVVMMFNWLLLFHTAR